MFNSLQCFIFVSNEFHKVGTVMRMDRSENIFFGFMNTIIFGISCRILMDLVMFDKNNCGIVCGSKFFWCLYMNTSSSSLNVLKIFKTLFFYLQRACVTPVVLK